MNNTLKQFKQTLERQIRTSNKVFIVGHNEPDFDAIASSIGLQVLGTNLLKKSYIVVDDKELESGVKKIIEEFRNKYNIITKKDCLAMKDSNSLLILTDVNKDYLISLKNHYKEFKNTIIIDHHKTDENTIPTRYTYIDLKTSSASEIVATILASYKFKSFDSNVANFLLAGIVLDTKRFSKNTSASTHDIVEKLMRKGASIDTVNDLFLREFEEDKKISNLTFSNTFFRVFDGGTFKNRNIAFTLNRQAPHTIYKREEIAKVADKLLKYKVDASFVLGYLNDNLVTISARSKSDIDVAEILSRIEDFQAGGNKNNAGGKVISDDIFSVEELIIEETTKYLKEKENEPFVLKKVKKY